MKAAWLCLAIALGLFGGGCTRTVVVHEGENEVHDDNSGDYWDGERWIVIRGHVHGPRCGHYYHSGAWHLHPIGYVYPHARFHHWHR